MVSIFTSAEALAELQDIATLMKLYRGVSKDEEVDYNGINYTAGDLMGELRKDYDWWDKIYTNALISENKSTEIAYKTIRGFDD